MLKLHTNNIGNLGFAKFSTLAPKSSELKRWWHAPVCRSLEADKLWSGSSRYEYSSVGSGSLGGEYWWYRININ